MQQFEIKIFANPSGFQELKLNNSDNLFTKEIIEKRNFDGDYGTFKDGTFSVLFTPTAFIIDYIFNVVADAGFRDPQTHIAIAIERGYILKDAYQVFTNLRKEFNLIAAEFKVNIARSLFNKSEAFNKIVEDNIEFAPDQFRISTSEIDVTKRALASYETEEQLNSLLEEPNRPKFKSYSLVYFLKKIDASELYKKESIKKYYSGIVMDDSDFNFHASYEVVFPDNYSITITSRSEVIDHTCNKLYYKSERFYGTLNDHMEDWEVTQSEDRTKFIIGKKLIPETKELQIVCYDTQKNIISTPKSLIFSLGTFYAQRSVLLLTGEEIDRSFECSSEDPRIRPNFIGRKSDVIYFTIIRHYCYDISAVFNYAFKTTKEDIKEVKIYKRKNRVPLTVLTKSNPSCYMEFTPDILEYEIPETKRFSSTRAGFDGTCHPIQPQFQKKDTVDVVFVIKNKSIVDNLGKKPVRCFFRSAHDESDEKYPHDGYFNEDGHLIIKELPHGNFSYKIKIDGYKSKENVLSLYANDKTKQIVLSFERTSLNRILRIFNKYKGSAAIFLIGLILGGFLRPYIDVPQNEGADNKEVDKLKADIANLESDTLSLNHEIRILQSQVQSLNNQINGNKAVLQDAAALAGGGHEVVTQPQNQEEQSHPEIIKNILTKLPKSDLDVIKATRNSNRYNYKPLSKAEKKELDFIFDSEDGVLYNALTSMTVSERQKSFKNVSTFGAAIPILKQKAGIE